MQIDENNPVNNELQLNRNNDLIWDDNDEDFDADSGDEDLIDDEESDDDDLDLISLSDLHVLDLESKIC